MKRALVACGILAGIGTASADGLDRAAVAAGMSAVKAKLMACGERTKVGGKINVMVTVGTDGKVLEVTRIEGDEKLGGCVADVLKTATFKTKTGGTFTYPLVFSGPTPPPASSGPAAGPPAAPPAGPPVEEEAPPTTSGDLDREAITTGIAAIKAKIVACGDKLKATGKLKITVRVGANGKVTLAKRESGDEALGKCVLGVIKTAKFAATKNGGSFTYPFVFGSPPAPSVPSPIPPVPPASTGPNDAANSHLDRDMIQDGVATVKLKIAECGKVSATAKGTVKIKVTVAGSGKVTNSEVAATPDAKLGACVADVLLHATFAKTGQGGSFSYPFVF